MRNAVCAIALGLMLAGCGGADREKSAQLQSEVEKLRAEVGKYQGELASLKGELEAERNGPERLWARSENQMSTGDRVAARKTLTDILTRFPESQQAKPARITISQIDAHIATAEKDQAAEAAREAQDKRQALARLDSSLSKTVDEFKGITWIQHKSQPVIKTYMAIYFGVKEGSAGGMPLRMKLNYFSNDWLFVQGVTIKADDETFTLSGLDFERDNGSGSIWEWSDTAVSDLAMITKIITSKRAVIRFTGRQYHDDFVIPESQKKAMKDMLVAWERYGGKP